MLIEYKPPMAPYLEIVYQDEDILVLNKPNGLLTVPGKALDHKDSLDYRVRLVWPLARIVHRLDMATSGLVVMAMHAQSQRDLNKQFELRQTKKRYLALVEGQLPVDSGSVDLPLICDWPNRPKQMVHFDSGKPSLTYFKVLERFQNQTKVELIPVTGRSHQLRVHMLWRGHPILGDKFYGSEEGKRAVNRLQLHASSLGFRHPSSGTELYFEVGCPF